MIQRMHLTATNIVRASKKLSEIHTQFSAREEKDAIYDFARMLRRRISRVKTACDFVTAYKKAATDIRNENKVPEAWDKSTESFVHRTMPFITKELFGQNFTKEVENITRARIKFVRLQKS